MVVAISTVGEDGGGKLLKALKLATAGGESRRPLCFVRTVYRNEGLTSGKWMFSL